jgi:hypothetical protein
LRFSRSDRFRTERICCVYDLDEQIVVCGIYGENLGDQDLIVGAMKTNHFPKVRLQNLDVMDRHRRPCSRQT